MADQNYNSTMKAGFFWYTHGPVFPNSQVSKVQQFYKQFIKFSFLNTQKLYRAKCTWIFVISLNFLFQKSKQLQ